MYIINGSTDLTYAIIYGYALTYMTSSLLFDTWAFPMFTNYQ